MSTDDGLYVVDAGAPGLAVEWEDTTSGIPEARLVLPGVPPPAWPAGGTDELVERPGRPLR